MNIMPFFLLLEVIIMITFFLSFPRLIFYKCPIMSIMKLLFVFIKFYILFFCVCHGYDLMSGMKFVGLRIL